MIQIKKQDKRSFDILLDYQGVQDFLIYTRHFEDNKEISLDINSIGFNNKSLFKLSIEKTDSEISLLNQHNGHLTFILEKDDIEYLIFRLNQYLESNDFSPPELFNLEYKELDITFYLKKYIP